VLMMMMEVNSRNVMPQASFKTKENIAATIKVGDINSIFIKERTGNNQAKVQLKGQEVIAQFEGDIPAGDRALVEVTQHNENGSIVVKPVISSQTQGAVDHIDELLKNAGFEPSAHPELKAAVSQILSRGGNISKDTVAVLQDFFKNEPGTAAEKLNTIKIMQQKNIELTKPQLNSVHTALNGEPLMKTLSKLLDGPIQIQANVPLKGQVPEAIQKEPQLDKTVATINKELKTNPDSQMTKLSNLVEKVLTSIDSVENRQAVKGAGEILSLLDPEKDQQAVVDMKKSIQIFQAGKQRIVQAIENSQLPNAMKEIVQQESNPSKILDTLKSTDMPTDIKDKIAQANQEAVKLENIGVNRLRAILKEFIKNEVSSKVEEPTSQVESIVSSNVQKTAGSSQNVAEESNVPNIKDIAKLIQKEPSMAKVLEGVQTLLESADLNELKSSFEKASQLMEQGRELAARKELATAINHIEEKHPQLQKSEQTLSDIEKHFINEAVQSLQFDSKNVLVTMITKRLSQLAIDFKKAKQEMSWNLDSASRLLEGNKPASMVPAKQMIDATIKELDHVLLKSDVVLYTDMTTEKKLLAASSKLAEAKNLLTKGKLIEANKIVKEVKETLDKLIFKPSNSKVMHLTKSDQLQSPKSMLEKAIQPLADHELGARQLFETMKGLGLTHEKDSTQALIDKKEIPHNLKEVLLKMVDTADSQVKPSVEQALANITGQQLLNKQDSSSMQNLFFQLPLLLNKQVESVKVYVNSQKQGEKIDWENCNLYFVLETKKLGEVGIMVSAVNRNLSITFKNDREELSENLSPLTEVTKERLQEIGYNVGTIQVKPLNDGLRADMQVEEKQPVFTPAFTEKGYDFSI
jgi:hypothetical protein